MSMTDGLNAIINQVRLVEIQPGASNLYWHDLDDICQTVLTDAQAADADEAAE